MHTETHDKLQLSTAERMIDAARLELQQKNFLSINTMTRLTTLLVHDERTIQQKTAFDQYKFLLETYKSGTELTSQLQMAIGISDQQIVSAQNNLKQLEKVAVEAVSIFPTSDHSSYEELLENLKTNQDMVPSLISILNYLLSNRKLQSDQVLLTFFQKLLDDVRSTDAENVSLYRMDQGDNKGPGMQWSN